MFFVKNLKMVTKLVGGFGVVLFLFTCVMGIYHMTVRSTSKNFENLMEINVTIANQAAEIKTLMKECRINEKNFISSFDTSYLRLIEGNINQIMVRTREILARAKNSPGGTPTGKNKKVEDFINAYATSFHDLSNAYEVRGLDANSGLRGDFGNAAQRLDAEMAFVNVEDLYLHMLRIVQLQNRFRLKNDADALVELETLVDDYARVITDSRAEVELIKDTLTEVTAAYKKSLTRLKTATTDDERDELYASMEEAIEEIDMLFSVTYLPNVASLLLKISGREKDYLLYGGDTYVTLVDKAIADLFTAIERSQIDQDYKDNSKKYLSAYKEAFERLVAEDLKIATLYDRMISAVNSAEPLIEELYNNSRSIAEKEMVQVTKNANLQSRLALFIGLGAIIIGFALSIFITRMITIPITRAVTFSKQMSKGDFTRKLDINQKDEIGDLARALNGIVTNIGTLVKEITGHVKTLSASSIGIKDISTQVSNGADCTSGKFNSAADATSQMSATLNSIATAIEQTSSNLTTVAAATEENTATINEIAKNSDQAWQMSKQAVTEVKTTSKDMTLLENATRDIGKITETISAISRQTNLLALNATIEAARAGEAGKGFAVVANEIKELARKTEESTKAISLQIENVQKTTAGTIKGNEKISAIIDGVNQIISNMAQTIEDQSKATLEISMNVSQGSLGINEVTKNVAECSHGASRISTQISGVNLDAGQMAENSSRLNLSAQELGQIAETLKEIMNQFEV